jgi:hypothetical protein
LLPFVANRHDLFLVIPIFFLASALPALAERAPALGRAVAAFAWLAALAAAASLAKDTNYRMQRYSEAGISPLADVWQPHTPAGAVKFLERSGIEGCVANRLSWGGYLLFHRSPTIRVAFDGRITTYGPEVYWDLVDFNRGRRCAEVAAKYNFDAAVAQPFLFGYGKPKENPQFQAPDLSRDWVEVYRDPDPSREGAAVVALRRASPLFERNLARAKEAAK